MNKKELSRLRMLARRATPGPWCVRGNDSGDDLFIGPVDSSASQYERDILLAEVFCEQDGERWPVTRNAAFIAAANPEAVLALLDHIDSLQAGKA